MPAADATPRRYDAGISVVGLDGTTNMGTLTQGRPMLNSIFVLDEAVGGDKAKKTAKKGRGKTERQKMTKENNGGNDSHWSETQLRVLQIAASVEVGSEHALGEAIVRGAHDSDVKLLKVDKFKALPGKGVRAEVGGKKNSVHAAVGNRAMMDELLSDISKKAIKSSDRDSKLEALAKKADELRDCGQSVMFFFENGVPTALLGVSDRIKETTRTALDDLRKRGIQVVMVTGDNKRTAQVVAKELDIADVEADVQPNEKADIVLRYKQAGHTVAMAGDGVNDSPALAAADVGIAMGTGADVAIESAGLTLVKGDLMTIDRAMRLGHATVWNIRQNILLAFLYNTCAIPVAALGLISPIIAAAAMTLSSISVIANALRLKYRKRL